MRSDCGSLHYQSRMIRANHHRTVQFGLPTVESTQHVTSCTVQFGLPTVESTQYVTSCTVQFGLPTVKSTQHVTSCTVQSGLPIVESTQHVLCNQCSLVKSQCRVNGLIPQYSKWVNTTIQ